MTGTQAQRLKRLIAALVEADREFIKRMERATDEETAQIALNSCPEEAQLKLAEAKLQHYINHLTRTRV